MNTKTSRAPNGYEFDRRAAAEYCGYAAASFAELACQDRGPAYLVVGGRAWYRRADLDAWLDSRRKVPAGDRCAA